LRDHNRPDAGAGPKSSWTRVSRASLRKRCAGILAVLSCRNRTSPSPVNSPVWSFHCMRSASITAVRPAPSDHARTLPEAWSNRLRRSATTFGAAIFRDGAPSRWRMAWVPFTRPLPGPPSLPPEKLASSPRTVTQILPRSSGRTASNDPVRASNGRGASVDFPASLEEGSTAERLRRLHPNRTAHPAATAQRVIWSAGMGHCTVAPEPSLRALGTPCRRGIVMQTSYRVGLRGVDPVPYNPEARKGQINRHKP